MIKKRLVGLLSHAKKYIVYQVIWQWLSLLCQILLIYSGTTLLTEALSGNVTPRMAAVYGILTVLAIALRVFLRERGIEGFLPGVHGCETDSAGQHLCQTAAAGRFLPGKGVHLRGGAALGRRRGSAGNVFRQISAPAFLQPAGSGDAVCCFWPS